ncbi:hypothetical protein DITRI_Ditri18aG0009300 [Diplodiscus trichospermus]
MFPCTLYSWFLLNFYDTDVKSLLLDDTSLFTGEKNAAPNHNSARGFKVVDNIKSAIEKACPGVVSCADILAIAARDSVTIVRPKFFIYNSNFTFNFNQANNGKKNTLLLVWAHIIGQARCTSFRAPIYNESNIDCSFAQTTQRNCPSATGSKDNNLALLDIQTPTSFDNNYFKNLVNRRGLLHSDQQLFNGDSTDSIVQGYNNNPSSFSSDYVASMIKMGDISPLTGSRGEIRRNCRRVN